MCTSKLGCQTDEKKNEKGDTAIIALVFFLQGTQIIVDNHRFRFFHGFSLVHFHGISFLISNVFQFLTSPFECVTTLFVRRSSSVKFLYLSRNRRLENVHIGKAQKPGKQVVMSNVPVLRGRHSHLLLFCLESLSLES